MTTCAPKRHGTGADPGPGPCPDCGRVRCKAKANRTGDRCRLFPVPGTEVCPMHGGSAPQVRAAGKRRVTDAKAAAKVAELLHDTDAPPVTDPLQALASLAGVIQHAVDVTGQAVNELSALGSTDYRGAEQLRTQVVVWQNLLALSSKTLTDMSKIDQGYRLARAAWERESSALLGVGLTWFVQMLGADPRDPYVAGLLRQMAQTLDAGQTLPPIPASVPYHLVPVLDDRPALEAGVDGGEDDDAD